MNMCNFKKLSSSPPLTGATMVSSSSSALQRFHWRYCFHLSVSSCCCTARFHTLTWLFFYFLHDFLFLLLGPCQRGNEPRLASVVSRRSRSVWAASPWRPAGLGSSDGDASCVNPVTFAVTALDIDPFKEGADREDIHCEYD